MRRVHFLQPPYQSPTEVAPSIYMVPIPIPIPLRYVNCYLCRGPSGWSLVDCGFHDALAEDAWPRAFDELGVRHQDIKQIVVTHYHPDHLGGAGWLQQLTGAPVYLHEPELRHVELFWGRSRPEQIAELETFFTGNGMPLETAKEIGSYHHLQFSNVQPLPAITPLPTGSRIAIGAAEYEVLWMPGHADGLAVFWDADSRLLLANDMILNKITPNVSVWPNCRPNPLEDYLASLAKVEAMGAELALPGHRTVITDVSARAVEIRHHHADRLNRMERLCAGVRGATAWEVCEEVFEPKTLTIHQVRFAMSETLAHLIYMEKQGRLLKKGDRFVQA